MERRQLPENWKQKKSSNYRCLLFRVVRERARYTKTNAAVQLNVTHNVSSALVILFTNVYTFPKTRQTKNVREMHTHTYALTSVRPLLVYRSQKYHRDKVAIMKSSQKKTEKSVTKAKSECRANVGSSMCVSSHMQAIERDKKRASTKHSHEQLESLAIVHTLQHKN